MKNNTVLIGVLVLLLVTKFIIVPIIDWQDSLIAETVKLERKITKSQKYLDNLPELIKHQKQLRKQLFEMKNQQETFVDVGLYKIEKQKQIEGLFNKHSLNIRTLNWRDEIETEKGVSISLNLQFKGSLKNVIELLLL